MTRLNRVEAQEGHDEMRELDQRTTDGIEVRLLWDTDTHAVFVSVTERDGRPFEFEVFPADALEAFRHPYAYAAHGCRQLRLAA